MAKEGLDAAGRLGGAHLDPAAGKGAHLELLAWPHPEMAQQLAAEGDLALGGDGEGGHGSNHRRIKRKAFGPYRRPSLG